MLENRLDSQYFVDLFCGGCNLIENVTGNRIANDIHPELISMYKALQEGWLPPKELSEEEYLLIKYNAPSVIDKYKDKYTVVRAVTGFAYSFGAKYFGGYRRGNASNGKPRDYILEGYNNITKQTPKLVNVTFLNLPYDEVSLPTNSIIYCDIPYKDTTKYSTKDFDYDKFYAWCLEIAKEHTLFVSEYNMPEEFECIWQKEQISSLDLNTGSKRAIEKLFIVRK